MKKNYIHISRSHRQIKVLDLSCIIAMRPYLYTTDIWETSCFNYHFRTLSSSSILAPVELLRHCQAKERHTTTPIQVFVFCGTYMMYHTKCHDPLNKVELIEGEFQYRQDVWLARMTGHSTIGVSCKKHDVPSKHRWPGNILKMSKSAFNGNEAYCRNESG